MDSVKVLGSLDYSVFIFSKLRVSPVRSSLIYLVKCFNIYIYAMFVQSKNTADDGFLIAPAFVAAGYTELKLYMNPR